MKKQFTDSSLAGAIDMLLFRGFSSLLTFLLAYLFNPTVVGYFAAPLMFLTLYQGLVEGPARTLLPQYSKEDYAVRRILRHGTRWSIIGSLSLLALTCGTHVFANSLNIDSALIAFYICLSPLISGRSLVNQLQLQLANKWAKLMFLRVSSTFIAFTICAGLVFTTGDPIYGAIFLLLVDLIVYLSSVRDSEVGKKPKLIEGKTGISSGVSSRLSSLIKLRLLNWFGSQSDRLVIAISSGPNLLGIFSLSYALARAIPEAAFLGASYRLSSQLGNLSEDMHVRQRLTKFIRGCGYLTVTYQVLIELLLFFFKGSISSEWSSIVWAVPLLTLTLLANFSTATLGNLMSQRGSFRGLSSLQFVLIFLSVVVGLSFSVSLVLGIILLAARDILMALATMYLCRRYVSFLFVTQVSLFVLFSCTLTLLARLAS